MASRLLHRRVLMRAGLILAGLLLLYTLAGFILAPLLIERLAVPRAAEALHRQITINAVQVNPFRLTLELQGLSLDGREKARRLFTADRVRLDFAAASIFKRALITQEIELIRPRVWLRRSPDGRLNISDIVPPAREPAQDEDPSAPVLFSLNSITVVDGSLVFQDKARRTTHRLTAIDFELPLFSNLDYHTDSPIQPAFSARLNGNPVSLSGRSLLFTEHKETLFSLELKDLDLPHYLNYLPGDPNTALTDGRLSANLQLDFRQEPQRGSRLSLTGKASLRDIRLEGAEQGAPPLLSLPGAELEFSSGNLLLGQVHLKSVRLDRPAARLIRRPDGSLHLPGRAEETPDENKTKRPKPDPEKEDGGSTFSLALDRFLLHKAEIVFQDNSLSPAFSAKIAPLDLTITDLRLPGSQPAGFSFQARTADGTSLIMRGRLGLSPARMFAELDVTGLSVPEYAAYFAEQLNGTLQSGTLDLSGQLDLKSEESLQITFEEPRLQLRRLSLHGKADTDGIQLSNMQLAGGHFNLQARELHLGSLLLEDGSLQTELGPDGSLSLTQLIPGRGGSGTGSTDPPPQGQEWGFRLGNCTLENIQLELIDRRYDHPATLQGSLNRLRLDNLSNDRDVPAALAADMSLAGQGRLRVSGDLSLSPVRTSLDFSLEELPLAPLQTYLDRSLNLRLLDGRFESTGRLRFAAAPEPGLQLQGRAAVHDLRTAAADHDAEFLSWRRLALRGIRISHPPLKLAADVLEADQADLSILIQPDGGSNLQEILDSAPPGSGTQATRPPAAQEPGLSVSIGEARLTGSRFVFMDQSIEPAFSLNLEGLNGRIEHLDSLDSKPAKLSLNGTVNGQAPARVQGLINPLADSSMADLRLSAANIDMTPLSPYAGKYLGYRIDKGKLNLQARHRIDGSRLQAENTLLLDQFTFGESVESPEAVNLPVQLAVALLKNRQGEIHVSQEITGDLEDPQFSLGGLIFKMVANLISKTVTSPFSMLGSLVGGTDMDIDRVLFPAGQTSLDQRARQKLQALSQAMYERPALQMEILGRAGRLFDGQALRLERFRDLLRAQKLEEAQTDGATGESLDGVEIREEEYGRYLWEAYKEAPFAKPENALGMVKRIPAGQMESALLDSIRIPDGDLRRLARDRAEAVRDFLIESGPVEADRLFIMDPRLGPEGDSGGGGGGGSSAEVEMRLR